MAARRAELRTDDPFDLNRFLDAQHESYAIALQEIRAGRKQSHWMWFIFPQIDGLGSSPTARHYAIRAARKPKPTCGIRFLAPACAECAEAALNINGRSARDVFGSPDDLKLHSSATLFAAVAPKRSVFGRVLERYFNGEPDQRTLDLLSAR